jgi:putative cardiolipin synthase
MVLAGLLAGCASTPPVRHAAPPVAARPPANQGPIADLDRSLRAQDQPDQSAFQELDSNADGLRLRLALVDAAQSSLDLQYYFWWDDQSGGLLMKHVLDAASRGVRVRLILDDLTTVLREKGLPKVRDWAAALINAHPNVEIRLFNAWQDRSLLARGAEFIGHADQMNQRMHNKLMVADNRAAVVGGRNVGDEYFGLSDEFNFRDLDVLAIGPVAQQASAVFDRFWNSSWVTPVADLNLGATRKDLAAAAPQAREQLAAAPALETFPLDPDRGALARLATATHPGAGHILTDVPSGDELRHRMAPAIRTLMSAAQHEILITNAYLIPDDSMIALFRELTQRGVVVRILTNSLASQDVSAVNSHYKQWRLKLLNAGVELHEMRADPAIQATIVDTAPVRSRYTGLHEKAMVIDRQSVFIGSMNLDPRSSSINTEMGALILSTAVGGELAGIMERDMQPQNSWQVRADAAGHLSWTDSAQTVTRQPARGFSQRFADVFFMMFPASLY